MTSRISTPLRVAAVAASTAVLGAMTALPAAGAESDDVQVVNTETVQVYTSPTGEVESQRIYEQLSMTGTGTVDLSNPISVEGLRNLDGFGGFDVDGGNQIAEVEVDGEERLRSVSDFNGKLPLDISVDYRIDGDRVEPGDVVGASGELEVLFTVKNVTGADQEVTFPDGKGGTVTKTVNVPIPMVGSLTTVTPSSFTDVESKQANMAGDGKGGTKLSFTMTLFPPIGSDTAEFGYTATITDGIVPEAAVSALPVNPLESPTFASAATSYQGGADTGIELTDGATQIDANLLKLRDGAGDLLAGLIKLRIGAQELEAGLAGEASPGANQLAAGAGELNDGLNRIDSGAGQLADGAGKASDGAGLLSDGAGQISGGLGELSGGAGELDAGAAKILAGQKDLRDGVKLLEAGVKTLPSTVRDGLKKNQQYMSLLAGMQTVVDKIGEPGDVTDPVTKEPATLFGGLNAVRYGLRAPGTADCQSALVGGEPSNCGVADAVELLDTMFRSSTDQQASTPENPAGFSDLQHLLYAANASYDVVTAANAGAPIKCPARGAGPLTLPPVAALGSQNPLCKAAASSAYGYGADRGAPGSFAQGGVISKSKAAATALREVHSQIDASMVPGLKEMNARLLNTNANPNCAVGVATSNKADDCGLKQAIAFFKSSIPVLVDGITENISQTLLGRVSVPDRGCDPQNMTLLCGAEALAAGGADLKDGTHKLLAGSGELDAGGFLLSEKLDELAAGLNRLDDGANTLADGTGTAADGSGRLADGADKLADGLGEAADGSGKIAGGLETAAGGAPKLEDGAQRLSDEGTKKLIEAGDATAQTYGELYATIEAGADRASTEKMAFGAPEGAAGLTAYSYEIQGEDGEGGRNLARGLGGLAILGAGAAAFALRRGMI